MKRLFFVLSSFMLVLNSCNKNAIEKTSPTPLNEIAANDFTFKITASLFANQGRGIFGETDTEATLLQNIDSVGKWHNQFLDTVFAKISRANTTICKPGFNDSIDAWSKAFFQTKNIGTTGSLLRYSKTLEPDTVRPVNDSRYSLLAATYLNKIDTLTAHFRFDSTAQYVNKYDSLAVLVKNNSSPIITNQERIMLLGSISLSKNSALYWNSNKNKWFTYFNGNCGRPATCLSCKLSPTEKAVLQADSKGAIAGAIGSAPGGPMIFAGALVGGGVMSCVKAIRIGTHSDGWLDWLF